MHYPPAQNKFRIFVFFSRFSFSTYFANNGLGLQYVWNLGSFYPIYHLFITAFGTSKKKTFNVRYFWFSYIYSRSHSKVSLEIQHQVGLMWWEKRIHRLFCLRLKFCSRVIICNHLVIFNTWELLFINSSSIKLGN